MWSYMVFACIWVGCGAYYTSTNDPHPSPISGAWFKDRYTAKEWDDTLDDFLSIGGDTVILGAASLMIQTPDEIKRDPDFAWCGSQVHPFEMLGPHCVTEAQEEMDKIGAKIQAWATYENEEDFGDKILLCKFDKIINTSRVYYRLIFPVTKTVTQSCDIRNGTNVMVVFTSYAGVDPHKLLVERASALNNVSVIFGLPAAPRINGMLATPLMPVYYDLTIRILLEHQTRYSDMKIWNGSILMAGSMYDVISGYHCRDETALSELLLPLPPGVYPFLNLYDNVVKLVHRIGKKLSVSPYLRPMNDSLQTHVAGFQALARAGCDVIAVQDGAGAGLGSHYYETQQNDSIAEKDPNLYKVIKNLYPSTRDNVTFAELFKASNQEIFKALGEARDQLVKQGNKFDFWVDISTYEFLWDDPCAPADRMASGNNQLLNRASISSIDMAVAATGGHVQKIIAYSWDPGYTCRTKTYNQTLLHQMYSDYQTPIITNCRWHFPQNMSVVVIGFTVGGRFEVKYQTDDSQWHDEVQYGSYYEMDYGEANDRVHSLQYTQLSNLWKIFHIKPHSHIWVKPVGAHHPCIYTY